MLFYFSLNQLIFSLWDYSLLGQSSQDLVSFPWSYDCFLGYSVDTVPKQSLSQSQAAFLLGFVYRSDPRHGLKHHSVPVYILPCLAESLLGFLPHAIQCSPRQWLGYLHQAEWERPCTFGRDERFTVWWTSDDSAKPLVLEARGRALYLLVNS